MKNPEKFFDEFAESDNKEECAEHNIDDFIKERQYNKAREEIEKIFDSKENGKQRVAALLELLDNFLKSDLVESGLRDKIIKDLGRCSGVENKEDFIEQAFLACKPAVDVAIKNPEGLESLRRERFVETGGFIKVNELVSYGKGGDIIHIHFAPAEYLLEKSGFVALKELAEQGLRRLAEIVEKDKDIKRIEATSWLVAKYPRIIKSFGFEIDGPISDEIREKYFSQNEERNIGASHIKREDFLEKYLYGKTI